MDSILAALAAVLVAGALVWIATGRVLARIRALEVLLAAPGPGPEIERLPDRIVGPVTESVSKAVADAVADLGAQVDALREELDQLSRRETRAAPRFAEEVAPLLAEAVDSLEARIRELAASLESRRDEGISEALSRALGEKGFVEVRIVSGPAFEGENTRVVVSARREGMPFKGAVLLSGRTVVEDRLSPAWPMFP